MKKLIFAAALLLACFSNKIANAQVSLSVNIGSQPDWGPVGYDHADYYYMPDIDSYYDVTNHLYIYNDNNVWVHRAFLPERYHFDRYRTYKVVVNDHNPWEHPEVIRTRYASYKGRNGQAVIRDSPDARYKKHYREVAEHNHEVAAHNGKVAHHNAVAAKHNRKMAAHNAKKVHHAREKERKEDHR